MHLRIGSKNVRSQILSYIPNEPIFVNCLDGINWSVRLRRESRKNNVFRITALILQPIAMNVIKELKCVCFEKEILPRVCLHSLRCRLRQQGPPNPQIHQPTSYMFFPPGQHLQVVETINAILCHLLFCPTPNYKPPFELQSPNRITMPSTNSNNPLTPRVTRSMSGASQTPANQNAPMASAVTGRSLKSIRQSTPGPKKLKVRFDCKSSLLLP